MRGRPTVYNIHVYMYIYLSVGVGVLLPPGLNLPLPFRLKDY